MEFTPDIDTENMVQRIVDRERGIEIGVYPVLFGLRVRAGYVNAFSCELDWCCGLRHETLEWAYAAARCILSRDVERPFDGVPGRSDVKPITNDPRFLVRVASLIREPLQIEPLPPGDELRERFFAEQWARIG